MAEQVGYAIHILQHLLGERYGMKAQVCAEVRLCSRASQRRDRDLAIDETSFLKRGESVGVGAAVLRTDGADRELSGGSVSRLHHISSKGQSLIDQTLLAEVLDYDSPAAQES